MEELSLPDILAILKRRFKPFLMTSIIILAIGTFFVMNWSNYRATATVDIEQSNVSTNITIPNGSSTGEVVNNYADKRITQVESRVTSDESLAAIIKKFNLYPEAVKYAPIEDIANQMKSKIKVTLVHDDASNPAAAQKQSIEDLSASAFTVSFDYTDPVIAAKVTNALVQQFIKEDADQRHQEAKATSVFLAAQIMALDASMAAQERKIAKFQAEHGLSGPTSLLFNQQAATSASMSIQNIDSQITANEGTQGNLQAQLAVTDPYTRVIADGQVLTTPLIQLKALKAQYATLSGQYGKNHPDVVKVRLQIQALEKQIGSHGDEDTANLKAQIIDVKTNLAAAMKTGGPNNPDTLQLQRQLKSLKAQLAASESSTSAASSKQDADNPAYLQILSQIKSLEEQHKSLVAQRDALVAQQTKYQLAIAENPVVEQQLAELSRDYDNAQIRYRELKEKKMAADMSEQLENNHEGQHLVLSDAAEVSRHTHPSRLILMLGVIAISIVGGFVSIIMAEALSQNIHGHNQLAAVLGTSPLVIIPYISNDNRIKHRIFPKRPSVANVKQPAKSTRSAKARS